MTRVTLYTLYFQLHEDHCRHFIFQLHEYSGIPERQETKPLPTVLKTLVCRCQG